MQIIYINQLVKNGLYDKIWQAYAALPIKLLGLWETQELMKISVY